MPNCRWSTASSVSYMVHRIKRGAQIKQHQSAHVFWVNSTDNFVVNGGDGGLSWVIGEILAEPGDDNSLHDYWDETQICDWSVWVEVVQVERRLLKPWFRNSLLIYKRWWEDSFDDWCVVHTRDGVGQQLQQPLHQARRDRVEWIIGETNRTLM